MIELPPNTDNFLDDSKAWDKLIGSLPEGAPKDAAAKIAINSLAGRNNLSGCTRLFVRANTAYAFPDSRQAMKGRQAIEFDEVALLGRLGLPDYLKFESSSGSALTWRIYDAQSVERYETNQEDVGLFAQELGLYMPTERSSDVPIQVPVNSIQFAFPAPANLRDNISP